MAATRRRFEPRDTSGRTLWVYVGLAVFVLVDVGLIVWALSSSRAPQDSGYVRPSAESIRPTPSTEPSPSAEAESAPTVTVAPTRILAALDETTAWRAVTGPCPATPATPEVTTDGGATWTVTDATDAGITAVQGIDVQSEEIAAVLGLTAEECSPQVARTFVAGADYSAAPDLVDATWHLDPVDAPVVVTPTGPTPAPCPTPVVLAPQGPTAAAVVCSDQAAWTTVDGGESWFASTPLPGVLDLSATDSGYIAVAAGARECAGVQVTELDASLVPGTSGCLPLDLPTSTLSGNVAVAQAADAIWVWAGDRVWRSVDGGATWQ